jgi:O-antigen/teichoic acid export membrane protein
MSKGKHYIWSAVGQFGTQTVGFIGNILIARILMPDDYGLIAMVAIFMGLAMTFTDSGFADCLIRKPDADRIDFGTVATFNIVIASFIYLAIFCSAPLIASFFERPELIGITRVISISILIKALNLTQITRLRKELLFKDLAIMLLQSSVISVSITYILALKGFGYWALVMQPVFISLLNLVYLVVVKKWIPFFKFNLERFREMFGFSINLLVSYITNTIGQNLYSIIIGKFYSVTSLGFYNQAKRMYEAPTYGINSVVLTTSYPMIAQERNLVKQRDMYIALLRSFMTLQSIIVFALIGLAEPVWLFLLGVKWISSVEFFKLFMLISLVYPLITVNQNIAKIHNEPKLYRNLTFLRNGLKIIALIVCAKSSLVAILYGQIIAAYVSVVVDIGLCGKIIDFGFGKQIKILLYTVIKPGIAFLVAYEVCNLVDGGVYLNGLIFAGTFMFSLTVIYIVTKDNVFFSFLRRAITAFDMLRLP